MNSTMPGHESALCNIVPCLRPCIIQLLNLVMVTDMQDEGMVVPPSQHEWVLQAILTVLECCAAPLPERSWTKPGWIIVSYQRYTNMPHYRTLRMSLVRQIDAASASGCYDVQIGEMLHS